MSSSPEPPARPDQLATALAGITPAALCTLCVVDLKQARAARQPELEVLPGVVMAGLLLGGVPTSVMLCEVRHGLNVGTPPPSLLVAPADAVPDPAALRPLGLVGR